MIINPNCGVTMLVPGNEKYFIPKEFTTEFISNINPDDPTHFHRIYMRCKDSVMFHAFKKNELTVKKLLKLA
jgi:hypothetical protein